MQYRKRWALARAEGRRTTPAPTGPIRKHIAALVAMGCSQSAVATAANVSPGAVADILAGTHPTAQIRVARALMNVTLADVITRAGNTQYLPRWAAQRRIKALHAIGYTHAHITAHLKPGLRSANVANASNGPYLRATTWRDVDRVYRELAMTPGPSHLTRTRAATLGYQPPLAWDNIDDPDPTTALAATDDPTDDNDTIDPVAVHLALAGVPTHLTRLERRAVGLELTARGMGSQKIADRLGVDQRTVIRWRIEDREKDTEQIEQEDAA